jgi:hypothetical protein
MASDADRILGQALNLAPHERAMIVVELLPGLPSAERTEAEWIQEIERSACASISDSPGSSWAEARTQIERGLSHP